MGNAPAREVPSLPEPPPLPGTASELEELRAACAVHLPGTAEYNAARIGGTWNLDPETFGRPSAISIPLTAEQVFAVVQFCVATGSEFTVCCGRHTPGSIKQGAMLIDLTSAMHSVTVDPEAKTITVGGGAKIGAVDLACKPHKFIVPLGRVGSTGCAGQIVCTGGHGYAERALGIGVDYLIRATVVTASGIMQCSATENTDLFWGIRGGHHNFGIVTEMVFRGQEAPNDGQFYGSQRVYLPIGMLGMTTRQGAMDYALKLMDVSAPREYGINGTFIAGGGGSPAIINQFWFGSNPEEGKAYFNKGPQHPGFAVADNSGVHDYWTGIQKWANGPKGQDAIAGCYYYRGVMCKQITEAMGRDIVAALEKPFPAGTQPLAMLDLMGGGVSQEVEPGSEALPTRPNFWIIFLCQWDPEVTGPDGREFARGWCRDIWKTTMEHTFDLCEGTEKVVVDNHMEKTDELIKETMLMGQQAKVNNIWGDNLDRMRRVKAQYDPNNVFGALD